MLSQTETRLAGRFPQGPGHQTMETVSEVMAGSDNGRQDHLPSSLVSDSVKKFLCPHAGYGSTMNYSGMGYGSGMYGSSYGGGYSGQLGGGMYGNTMYRGYGGAYGGAGMYGGGMYGGGYGASPYGGGYGMQMGVGMGMGGPPGSQDPNSPFGAPASPPSFWMSLMRVVRPSFFILVLVIFSPFTVFPAIWGRE